MCFTFIYKQCSSDSACVYAHLYIYMYMYMYTFWVCTIPILRVLNICYMFKKALEIEN